MRRNIERSPFFQREFKVLTFFLLNKFFGNHTIDFRHF